MITSSSDIDLVYIVAVHGYSAFLMLNLSPSGDEMGIVVPCLAIAVFLGKYDEMRNAFNVSQCCHFSSIVQTRPYCSIHWWCVSYESLSSQTHSIFVRKPSGISG